MGILQAIVERKRAEVAELASNDAAREARRTASLASAPPSSPTPEPAPSPRAGAVAAALLRKPGERLRLITEIKRRSPSAGSLSTVLSVEARALAYARGGASMISVLCDAHFFDGAWEHLAVARRALDAAGLSTPLLAKEFVIDERQIERAARSGADAVLIIVRIVSHERVRPLVERARALGLEPLVEVVNEDELGVAIDAGATVVGVNARDLDTLVMDAPRAARVLAAVPGTVIALHLSGLKTPDDVRAVAATKADGALMGEALMREDDPTPLLRSLVAY